MEPVRGEALRDEAAAERVEGEQRREPKDDVPRSIDARQRREEGEWLRRVTRRRRHLDSRRQPHEQQREQEPEYRVENDDRAIAGRRIGRRVQEKLRRPPGGQRTRRRGNRTSQRVPAVDFRPPSIGHERRQRRLLNREERSHFLSARTDHADGCRQQQRPEMRRHRHDDAGARHEEGATDEHPSTPHAIGTRRDEKRQRGVAE